MNCRRETANAYRALQCPIVQLGLIDAKRGVIREHDSKNYHFGRQLYAAGKGFTAQAILNLLTIDDLWKGKPNGTEKETQARPQD